MTTIRRLSDSVTPRQLEVLASLSQREQWSISQVASFLGVSCAAATKVITRLERKGLVSRTVDLMDRRYVNVRVTHIGSEILRREGI